MNKMVASGVVVLIGMLLLPPPGASAQELFTVTGAFPSGAATWRGPGAEPRALNVGALLAPGTVRLADGGQLMLLETSGVVGVVLGPAVIDLARDELTGGVQVNLESGRLMLTSARRPGEGRVISVTSPAPPGGPLSVEFSVVPGRVYVATDDRAVSITFVPDDPAGVLGVRVNAAAVTLASGQLLTVAKDGSHRLQPAGDWRAQHGFDRSWGRDIGVASAQASRRDVETSLFNNIISWDRYAGAAGVVPRLAGQQFNPEIRQTVQTVSGVSRTGTRAGPVGTQPFAAANEVPLVSPAALSVQNIAQGVTALQLNQRASRLLESTGSRGLGFRGLLQLAIPGFSGGQRTAGPAGLAAP